MSGCSRLTRRRFRRDPTHALFADQSHSFPDNLVALLGQIGAWNYSADTARAAGSLLASQRVRKLNRARLTRWHPVGGGSLSRLAQTAASAMPASAPTARRSTPSLSSCAPKDAARFTARR